jgi:hypothetical protein
MRGVRDGRRKVLWRINTCLHNFVNKVWKIETVWQTQIYRHEGEKYCHVLKRRPSSSASVATRMRFGQPANWELFFRWKQRSYYLNMSAKSIYWRAGRPVFNSQQGKIVFSIPLRPDWLWGPSSKCVPGACYSGIKRPGHGADLYRVKNGGALLPLATCLHGVGLNNWTQELYHFHENIRL